MKLTASMALMLTFAAAGVYAQKIPVSMTFSGEGGPSVIDLKQPNTSTSEENISGSGTQGPFTFRLVHAGTSAPQPSLTCVGPTKLHFLEVTGTGLFRFYDGSLLTVNLTGGDDCIDLAANQAVCIWTFLVTGGTGRFKGATGAITITLASMPILSDATSNPVLFMETGEFTGTIVKASDSKP